MDTGKQLNAKELIAKIQELEKENARQRTFLYLFRNNYVATHFFLRGDARKNAWGRKNKSKGSDIFSFFVLIYNKRNDIRYRFPFLSLHLQTENHGVLRESAEIIPIEPDAGNADAGIYDITEGYEDKETS